MRSEEERRKDLKPIAVGSIEVYPERFGANLGIPQDALTPILQMLIAGHLKFVVMRGAKFRYRAPVSSATASRPSSPRTTSWQKRRTRSGFAPVPRSPQQLSAIRFKSAVGGIKLSTQGKSR